MKSVCGEHGSPCTMESSFVQNFPMSSMRRSIGWPGIRLFLAALSIVALAACPFRSLREDGPPAQLSPEGYRSLDRFPFREAWYGIYFEDDKIGYSHFKISQGKNSFVIAFDSVIRLRIRAQTKEIDLKESVNVKPDLSLMSFDSQVFMNSKQMEMRGVVRASRLEVEIAVGGENIKRGYEFPSTLYHSSAVSLMPALRGIRDGQAYSFLTFNAQKQQVEKVEQTISRVTGGPGPNKSVWKVRTVCGDSVMYSWLNEEGLPVIDKGSKEPIITFLEDETSAKNFLRRKKQGLLRRNLDSPSAFAETLDLGLVCGA